MGTVCGPYRHYSIRGHAQRWVIRYVELVRPIEATGQNFKFEHTFSCFYSWSDEVVSMAGASPATTILRLRPSICFVYSSGRACPCHVSTCAMIFATIFSLFPLDGCWRLGGNIIDNTIDTGNLVHDAVGDAS